MTPGAVTAPCPFCTPNPTRVFLRLPHAFALWDGFPVSDGHALIVPYRHVATWFDASDVERAELMGAIDAVCAVISKRFGADGFNFGINVGAAAGQTVPHLHMHVIPRRNGDMADPRGGVRHVIPGKGNYLRGTEPAAPASVADAAVVGHVVREADYLTGPAAQSSSPLRGQHDLQKANPPPRLTTGESNPLLPHLIRDLASATRVDIAVAFVLPSGVERLYAHFDDLLARGGELRLLSGDYLDISDPDALQRLLDLQSTHGASRVQMRIFISAGVSFHPKAYLLTRGYTEGVAYIGSSNLSASALTEGVEWNCRISSTESSAFTQRERGAGGDGALLPSPALLGESAARGAQPVGGEGASSRDTASNSTLLEIRAAFSNLFRHPQTRALDADWIAAYRQRRRPPTQTHDQPSDTAVEPAAPIPEPSAIQREALAALTATRAAGNRAGLVVMATGLGKTWLAAFDIADPQFNRVLFIAHREEILDQALKTFRRIRPTATLGKYTGSERATEAQIVFASIQTLSRQNHLDKFDPAAFDYLIVDEFHHAAAATYRRLINHFDPAFLLGLTATPERSDGGDLLALCGENLVYRCLVPRGIKENLLCAYQYFGVPDDVDYANIPWRSTRFDEQRLTEAVATQRRADNILAQWRKRGGARTIAFCVSQRHADFMRAHFEAAGVPCAAVHAGKTTDPRALSLERLSAGEVKIVFSVDMFNEGVDVPAIDTVMMLRPTESAIVWLQQFGRGLRKLGDKRLTVVDYIGNHRSFLTKVRALLGIEHGGDRALLAALQAVKTGDFDLPPGCAVTYELETLDILRALLRVAPDGTDALRDYYTDFRDRHGQRPTASEVFHDGYLPATARRAHGSWFGLVHAMGDLSPDEQAAIAAAGNFLSALETTRLTRSYKLLVLLAMLDTDAIPGAGIDIDTLTTQFAHTAQRTAKLRHDVGPAVDNGAALRTLIESNPINAWTGTAAIPGSARFSYTNGQLRYTDPIPDHARTAFQSLARELVEWRLAEYLTRSGDQTSAIGFVMKVIQSSGKPILMLPDRGATASAGSALVGLDLSERPSLGPDSAKPATIPTGWQPILIDGIAHEANFVKITVNVVRLKGSEDNVLPKILRTWFGPDAGKPGTNFQVSCEPESDHWTWRPIGRAPDDKPELFKRYSREQIPRLFGQTFSQAIWNVGFVVLTPDDPKHLILLVTLDKTTHATTFQYGDCFLDAMHFQWQSQNRTLANSKHGNLIQRHAELGIQVHLFVRADKKISSVAAPFFYCGPVTFERWEGSAPITVVWRLGEGLPERLVAELAEQNP